MHTPSFETRDIGLAGFLLVHGHQLLRTERIGTGRYTFVFGDFAGREATMMRYFNRQAAVEPLAFLDSIRNLKGLTQR